MLEIRWHGRGGQGAVTSGEMLTLAAIEEDKYGQGFPMFGPERRGSPVAAFTRVDEKQIKIRHYIYKPDAVVVLDAGLVDVVDVTDGLKSEGAIVINTSMSAEEMKKKLGFSGKVATVDATRIAWDELGVPIVNTTMLGALLKVVPIVKVASLKTPLEKRFGKIAKKNINALNRAYKEVKISKQSK